jgi:hypothetical protein
MLQVGATGGGGGEEDSPTRIHVTYAVEYVHALSILAQLSSVPPRLSHITRNLNRNTSTCSLYRIPRKNYVV